MTINKNNLDKKFEKKTFKRNKNGHMAQWAIILIVSQLKLKRKEAENNSTSQLHFKQVQHLASGED